MTTMLIGELARSAGVKTSAIRYYESMGLLLSPQRSNVGYRLYTEHHRSRLDFILRARALGLTLDEIGEIVAFSERGEAPCTHVDRLICSKIAEIGTKIEQLRRLQGELQALHEQAQALTLPITSEGNCVCQIIERH